MIVVHTGINFRITITTKGKYTAIKEGKAIQPLVDLVDDSKSEVRLNALKVQLYIDHDVI